MWPSVGKTMLNLLCDTGSDAQSALWPFVPLCVQPSAFVSPLNVFGFFISFRSFLIKASFQWSFIELIRAEGERERHRQKVSQYGGGTVAGVVLEPAVRVFGTQSPLAAPARFTAQSSAKCLLPFLDLHHHHYLASALANNNGLIKHSAVLSLWLWGHFHPGLQYHDLILQILHHQLIVMESSSWKLF